MMWLSAISSLAGLGREQHEDVARVTGAARGNGCWGSSRLRRQIVEPLIAASIVFVAIENLVRDPGASRWKVTFAFGLVHGFGFAGALRVNLGIGTRWGEASRCRSPASILASRQVR